MTSQQFTLDGALDLKSLSEKLNLYEQLRFLELRQITVHPQSSGMNLGTFSSQPQQLRPLVVVVKGTPCEGTKFLEAKIFVVGVLTPVEVYRLP